MLAMATRVTEDFGQLLSSLDNTGYAYPKSLLPHKKERIEEALRTLLQTPGITSEVRESLMQAFVYLSQFVDDETAEIISREQRNIAPQESPREVKDLHLDEQAMRAINTIKLNMESALKTAQELVATAA